MAPRIWFITGCSTGFGRQVTLEALKRGDKVIATARNLEKLSELKEAGADVLPFDVSTDSKSIEQTIKTAHDIHGRIDVVLNNAGYVLEGAIEELTPEEIQASFQTNVFGPLNIIRAVTPYMRAQGSGTIANVSSISGWNEFSGCGVYCGTKSALSIFTETLRDELKPFGISVTVIEPGVFRSNLLHKGNRLGPKNQLSHYDGTAARSGMEALSNLNNTQIGDVKKGSRAIVDVLTSTGAAAGREIPRRFAPGADATEAVGGKCRRTLAELEEWKDIATATSFDDANV